MATLGGQIPQKRGQANDAPRLLPVPSSGSLRSPGVTSGERVVSSMRSELKLAQAAANVRRTPTNVIEGSAQRVVCAVTVQGNTQWPLRAQTAGYPGLGPPPRSFLTGRVNKLRWRSGVCGVVGRYSRVTATPVEAIRPVSPTGIPPRIEGGTERPARKMQGVRWIGVQGWVTATGKLCHRDPSPS